LAYSIKKGIRKMRRQEAGKKRWTMRTFKEIRKEEEGPIKERNTFVNGRVSFLDVV
jgi:hypothetical protein